MNIWIYRFLSCVLVTLVIQGTAAADSVLGIRNGAVIRGGAFHLRCASANRVCGALQWLKSSLTGQEDTISYGRSLMSNFGGRYAMNDSGVPCDVTISNVQTVDAGDFACVSPDNGRQSAFLAILDSAPRCWHDAADGLVMEGDQVRVHCSLEGYHTSAEARLEWLDARDQAVLSAAVTQRPGAVNSTFIVSAKSPSIYPFTCRTLFEPQETKIGAARNVPEVTCSTQEIHVVYPVRDIRLLMNGTRLTSGKIVTCRADGKPRPSYHWVTLTNGDVRYSDSVVIETGHIYQCVASNVIRSRVYEDKSWEIYVFTNSSHIGTSTVTVPNTSTKSTSIASSSSIITSTSTSTSNSTSSSTVTTTTFPVFYEEEVQPNNIIHDVTVDYADVIGQERNINLSSLVLGVFLLVSLVFLLILLVHYFRLRDRLKEMKLLEAIRDQTTVQHSNSPHAVTVATARQIMSPVEQNGCYKTVADKNYKHPEVSYKPLSKPIVLSNGRIHDDVYMEVDKRT